MDLSGARVGWSWTRVRPILPGIFDVQAHYNVTLMLRPRTEEFHAMPVIYLANGVDLTFTQRRV